MSVSGGVVKEGGVPTGNVVTVSGSDINLVSLSRPVGGVLIPLSSIFGAGAWGEFHRESSLTKRATCAVLFSTAVQKASVCLSVEDTADRSKLSNCVSRESDEFDLEYSDAS